MFNIKRQIFTLLFTSAIIVLSNKFFWKDRVILKKSSIFVSFLCSLMFIFMSTITCFAAETNYVTTGDSTTIIVVAMGILMVAAIVAIILMSRKKK